MFEVDGQRILPGVLIEGFQLTVFNPSQILNRPLAVFQGNAFSEVFG
jgi:hypothetical protein